jgi:hypothetical protein
VIIEKGQSPGLRAAGLPYFYTSAQHRAEEIYLRLESGELHPKGDSEMSFSFNILCKLIKMMGG